MRSSLETKERSELLEAELSHLIRLAFIKQVKGVIEEKKKKVK